MSTIRSQNFALGEPAAEDLPASVGAGAGGDVGGLVQGHACAAVAHARGADEDRRADRLQRPRRPAGGPAEHRGVAGPSGGRGRPPPSSHARLDAKLLTIAAFGVAPPSGAKRGVLVVHRGFDPVASSDIPVAPFDPGHGDRIAREFSAHAKAAGADDPLCGPASADTLSRGAGNAAILPGAAPAGGCRAQDFIP